MHGDCSVVNHPYQSENHCSNPAIGILWPTDHYLITSREWRNKNMYPKLKGKRLCSDHHYMYERDMVNI